MLVTKTPRSSTASDESSSSVVWYSLHDKEAMAAALLAEGHLNRALQNTVSIEKPRIKTAFYQVAQQLWSSAGVNVKDSSFIVERTPVRFICTAVFDDPSLEEDLRQAMKHVVANAVWRTLQDELKEHVPRPAALLEELHAFAASALFGNTPVTAWDTTKPVRDQAQHLYALEHNKPLPGSVAGRMPTLVRFSVAILKDYLGVPW